eukprot:TRINITY_DN15031_c0_g1_i1.p1 TRINITY_DN15031_c0_g1~~TRINITY_DN15031_c0_g1_i1.p1  ORF type:complete len:385 (+),score=24.50 TRINITY_DN15031_c0_g1_i1:29-1183(+)
MKSIRSDRPLAAVLVLGITTSLLVYLCLSIRFRDTPYTHFYRPNGPELWRLADQRLSRSLEHLNFLQDGGWKYPASAGENVDVCIGIMTAKRAQHYVLQLVSSLISHMSGDDYRSTRLIVLNGDVENSEDTSILRSVGINVVDSVLSPNEYHWYHRIRLGYAQMLDLCRENSRYTLILEDDTISTSRWLKKLRSGMQGLPRDNNWFLLRLYRTEKFDGWGNAEVPSLLVFGSLLAFVTTYLASRLAPRLRYSKKAMLALFAIVMANAIALPLLLNRWTFFPYRPGIVETPRMSCCNQAFLYPSAATGELAAYLRRPDLADIGVDFHIDDFVYAQPDTRRQFLLVPSLFDHTGLFSSGRANGTLLSNQGNFKKHHNSLTFVEEDS